jgi:hypothetical protein
MDFTLSHSILERLCRANRFPIDLYSNEMVFFGLRGCLPVLPDDQSFKESHACRVEDVNYLNPRCTLGQWKQAERTIAVFPGSTIPHKKYVKESAAKQGIGANQLMTGFYTDYRKGVHRPGEMTACEAFRQTSTHPIQRTEDDLNFDNADRVEYDNPFDNIHAAWCMSVNQSNFESKGCQVVLGFPACAQRGQNPAAGPWKIFKDGAYARPQQQVFPYLLLTGRDAEAATNTMSSGVRLRFGSTGDLVTRVQQALIDRQYENVPLNGVFNIPTMKGILRFQEDAFGPLADDGIVGPITAEALGVPWPNS